MNPLPSRSTSPSFSGIWAGLLIFGLLISLALPALAQRPTSNKEVTLSLLLPRPEGENLEVRRLTHAEMARIASERITLRLERAGVKDVEVTIERHGILKVVAVTRMSKALVASIVVPAGHMELRPLVPSGDEWLSIVDSLPGGIELRQDEASFDPMAAYLWSPRQAALESFVRRVSLGDVEVFVYPEDGGWRTLSLGASMAGHANLRDVQQKVTPMGSPFVILEFDGSGPARLRSALEGKAVQELAVVLDGEIVNIVRYNTDRFTNQLELSPPPHLSTVASQRIWASQVAGRLAAYLPVKLVEMKE